MSLAINNNLMANNTQRLLQNNYDNLGSSIQKLSSGMRINSASDDAAGLAISELMRADIASFSQGIRNTNDAISLIQTADGALQVIDELLIRMKELAEQSATGTYDANQRAIIDSEFQQLAKEIDRIANSTEFNGQTLIDGSLFGDYGIDETTNESTGEMKIHFGTTNDCASDYYYIDIPSATTDGLGLNANIEEKTLADIVGSTDGTSGTANTPLDTTTTNAGYILIPAGTSNIEITISSSASGDENGTNNNTIEIFNRDLEHVSGTENGTDVNTSNGYFDEDAGDGTYVPTDNVYTDATGGNQLNNDGYADNSTNTVNGVTIDYEKEEMVLADGSDWDKYISADGTDATIDDYPLLYDTSDNVTLRNYLDSIDVIGYLTDDTATDYYFQNSDGDWELITTSTEALDLWGQKMQAVPTGTAPEANPAGNMVTGGATVNTLSRAILVDALESGYHDGETLFYLNNSLIDPSEWENNTANWQTIRAEFISGTNFRVNPPVSPAPEVTVTETIKIDGPLTEDLIIYIGGDNSNFTIESATWDGEMGTGREVVGDLKVDTQEGAASALEIIESAIITKDNIRAHLGALQNRFEATTSNLEIQRENLQAAQSRIRDTDVATEMTLFTKNQILTNSAVSMLAQANHIPQLAQQLLQ